MSELSPYPKPGDPPLPPPTLGTFNDGWETRRMPDAVRAAALANAVDLLAHDPGVMVDASTDPADFVINLARKFETYLAPGEEAHGTPNH